jgi:hypothetical protein
MHDVPLIPTKIAAQERCVHVRNRTVSRYIGAPAEHISHVIKVRF